MRLFDRLMIGAYDWALFPAALIFMALVAFGQWPIGLRDPALEKLVICQREALQQKTKEGAVNCLIDATGARDHLPGTAALRSATNH
jgi:hypothetical protein